MIKNIFQPFLNFPKFPDGRINYSNSDIAPVVIVFAEYNNKILLLKRSEKVRTYKGRWNIIAGYLDDPSESIEDKIYEELEEEAGIEKEMVESIYVGEVFDEVDNEINKTWVTAPVLAKLKKDPEIKLDWEHTEYKWVEKDKVLEIAPWLEEEFNKIAEYL